MKKIIKVGICGFGVVGKIRYENICKSNKYKVIGICDKRIKKNYTYNKINFSNSIYKLLKLNLDAIFICVTNDVAAKYTIISLSYGLHVFCEKPPAVNVSELKKVGRIFYKNISLKLKYGFNHRYHSSVINSLKLLKSNKFGKIVSLSGVYGKSSFEPWKGQGNWRIKRKKSGGGILLDQGIHLVDLIRLFGGEFTEIKSFISNDHWKNEIEDNAYSIMRSKQGVIATVHSSATQWEHLFELKIILEKGFINLKGILSGSKSYGSENLIVGRKNSKKLKIKKYIFNKDYSWKKEIDEFANAIIYDKKINNGTFEDALKTMDLVFRIYKSDYKWRKKFQ